MPGSHPNRVHPSQQISTALRHMVNGSDALYMPMTIDDSQPSVVNTRPVQPIQRTTAISPSIQSKSRSLYAPLASDTPVVSSHTPVTAALLVQQQRVSAARAALAAAQAQRRAVVSDDFVLSAETAARVACGTTHGALVPSLRKQPAQAPPSPEETETPARERQSAHRAIAPVSYDGSPEPQSPPHGGLIVSADKDRSPASSVNALKPAGTATLKDAYVEGRPPTPPHRRDPSALMAAVGASAAHRFAHRPLDNHVLPFGGTVLRDDNLAHSAAAASVTRGANTVRALLGGSEAAHVDAVYVQQRAPPRWDRSGSVARCLSTASAETAATAAQYDLHGTATRGPQPAVASAGGACAASWTAVGPNGEVVRLLRLPPSAAAGASPLRGGQRGRARRRPSPPRCDPSRSSTASCSWRSRRSRSDCSSSCTASDCGYSSSSSGGTRSASSDSRDRSWSSRSSSQRGARNALRHSRPPPGSARRPDARPRAARGRDRAPRDDPSERATRHPRRHSGAVRDSESYSRAPRAASPSSPSPLHVVEVGVAEQIQALCERLGNAVAAVAAQARGEPSGSDTSAVNPSVDGRRGALPSRVRCGFARSLSVASEPDSDAPGTSGGQSGAMEGIAGAMSSVSARPGEPMCKYATLTLGPISQSCPRGDASSYTSQSLLPEQTAATWAGRAGYATDSASIARHQSPPLRDDHGRRPVSALTRNPLRFAAMGGSAAFATTGLIPMVRAPLDDVAAYPSSRRPLPFTQQRAPSVGVDRDAFGRAHGFDARPDTAQYRDVSESARDQLLSMPNSASIESVTNRKYSALSASGLPTCHAPTSSLGGHHHPLASFGGSHVRPFAAQSHKSHVVPTLISPSQYDVLTDASPAQLRTQCVGDAAAPRAHASTLASSVQSPSHIGHVDVRSGAPRGFPLRASFLSRVNGDVGGRTNLHPEQVNRARGDAGDALLPREPVATLRRSVSIHV